jgi:hypothetical protein
MRFGADYNPIDFEAQNTYYPPQSTSSDYVSMTPDEVLRLANEASAARAKDSYVTASNSTVPVDTNSVDTGGGGLLDKGLKVFTGLVDIWGRPAQPTVGPVAPPPSTPLWVWIALPVAGIITLGLAARMLRSKKRYAGYRRGRRSKR